MIIHLDIRQFNQSEDTVIWDVRDEINFNEGHIAFAKNQPLASLTKELLDNTQGDIYVLCGGGTKAEKACQLLESFDKNRQIIHLIGGTRAAKALGMPIISENI